MNWIIMIDGYRISTIHATTRERAQMVAAATYGSETGLRVLEDLTEVVEEESEEQNR